MCLKQKNYIIELLKEWTWGKIKSWFYTWHDQKTFSAEEVICLKGRRSQINLVSSSLIALFYNNLPSKLWIICYFYCYGCINSDYYCE